jgi:hypothetical protein
VALHAYPFSPSTNYRTQHDQQHAGTNFQARSEEQQKLVSQNLRDSHPSTAGRHQAEHTNGASSSPSLLKTRASSHKRTPTWDNLRSTQNLRPQVHSVDSVSPHLWRAAARVSCPASTGNEGFLRGVGPPQRGLGPSGGRGGAHPILRGGDDMTKKPLLPPQLGLCPSLTAGADLFGCSAAIQRGRQRSLAALLLRTGKSIHMANHTADK